MAFRGKEWQPPDPKQVEEFIRDRFLLTELNPDVLKPILEQAIFDRRAEQPSEAEEFPADLVDSTYLNMDKLTTVNRSYYKAMQKVVESIDDKERVNIVIPVYNSIHLVKECIQKVLDCTFWPYHMTIVDDASDKTTNAELVAFAAKYPDKLTLLTNRKNRGFSATVNRGIKHNETSFSYTCLLNSDVLVTPYWLSKMVAALKADPKNKIVNPVTNNTAVINVGMHAGFTYKNMNTLLEATTGRTYPEIMPTGFCFLFSNNLLHSIGYLDESYQNFAEEMIHVTTRIYTGNGWKQLGDITTEDKIYGLDGKLHNVVKLTDIMYKPCYKLEFDTGEKIIASEGHSWYVESQNYVNNKNNSKPHRVSWLVYNQVADAIDSGLTTKELSEKFNVVLRTAQSWVARHKQDNLRKTGIDYVPGKYRTKELFDMGTVFSRGKNQSNQYKFWIPLAKALEFPEKPLLLDPYTLGAWLGDGTSANSQLTGIDPEIWENIEKAGFIVMHHKCVKSHNIKGLVPYLRSLNLINNKHIPEDYLYSSYTQRLSLLQGLMDTDGHCSKSGKCSFDNTNLNLIEGVAWLLRSLGIKCQINNGPPKKQKRHKEIYKVIFRCSKDLPVFRLQRKLNTLPSKLGKNQQYHKIVSIKPCPTVPTRCLGIDSPDHLFLAGESLIPTSNTDLWMRTICYSNGKTFDQWRAVLADDTYVFHQRGASYESLGDEQHMNFRKTASAKFRAAWPSWTVWNKSIDLNKSVVPLRKMKTDKLVLDDILKENSITRAPVCFVTHSVEACGGMHYIADIVNFINDNGGDARVALIPRPGYKVVDAIAELRCGNYVFRDNDDFVNEFKRKVFSNGIVIAATAELAPLVDAVCKDAPNLTGVLHAQSYEPALTNDPVESDQLKGNFFKLPHIISNSNWITKELEGANVLDTISPGVDREIFYPSKPRESGDERPTLLISLNGSYPFKGAQRGVQVAIALQNIAKAKGVDIRILAYGVDNIQGMIPGIICQGKLARTRIAQLLASETDVFLDPSTNHSYGMPALEAIACGVPVIGWNNRGIREYLPALPKENDPILSNDTPVGQIASIIFDALIAPDLRKSINQFQSKCLEGHSRANSVRRFDQALSKLRPQGSSKLKICMVTPHLRKHGGPTTIITLGNELAKRGHEVVIATVYSDLNPSVIKYTELPIILLNQSAKSIPQCDVLISNSDNPLNPAFVNECPQAKKKVMLKLSHNPRFQDLEEIGLCQKWDAIVTSSQWLADICEEPGTWNYLPVKATRIGWYHYNFDIMKRNIKRKRFHDIHQNESITISTLIHHHPLKGSNEAGVIFAALRKEYGDKIDLVGVGEIDQKDVRIKIPGVKYVQSPTRQELSDLFFKTDIWLGCSQNEGLGRMALEAMTGGAACVLMDTGAEYVLDGENAFVVKIGDINASIQFTNQLIQDVELRKNIAIKGYLTAKNMANSTDCINKLEEVIFSVL